MAGKNRAIVVGINKYQDPSIPELKGAETDAQEIREILTQDGHFEILDSHFLLGKDATHAGVRAAISDLLWSTDSCDVSLFYFSGHGFQDSYGTGYIAPHDMERKRPLVHGIEMQGLRRLALHSPNKQAVVLILDCCYAGVAAEEKGASASIDAAERAFSDLADIQPTRAKAAGVFVFSSSAKDEVSREIALCEHKLGKGDPHHHGAFSFHLIEGLMGVAANGESGDISVTMLRSHIDRALQNRHDQTFKCYESSATFPDAIILARASGLDDLKRQLQSIEANLSSEDFEDSIIAAWQLSRLLKERPNYEPAKCLRPTVETALHSREEQCRNWWLDNRFELMQQAKKVCATLEELSADMSLSGIGGLDNRNLAQLQYLIKAAQKKWSVSQLLTYVYPGHAAPKAMLSGSSLGTRGVQ